MLTSALFSRENDVGKHTMIECIHSTVGPPDDYKLQTEFITQTYDGTLLCDDKNCY